MGLEHQHFHHDHLGQHRFFTMAVFRPSFNFLIPRLAVTLFVKVIVDKRRLPETLISYIFGLPLLNF